MGRPNWLDNVGGALEQLEDEVGCLKDLAKAFSDVGNSYVSDRLRDIAEGVEYCGDVVRLALDEKQGADMSEAKASVAENLRAIRDLIESILSVDSTEYPSSGGGA